MGFHLRSSCLLSLVEDRDNDTCEWLQQVCLVFSSHGSLKLRRLPATTPRNGQAMAVSINSSLVSLITDCENRLEICKLELDPGPQLQTLCFLELPPLTSGASHFFRRAYKEWVPTSKTYARTRSSRGYHLPFYTSAIGAMSLLFVYRQPEGLMCQYMLTISVRALISVIPTVVCNVPWEDWGPSSTHLQHFYESRSRPQLLMSVGSFWIRGRQVRQYDLWRKNTSLLQSRPPIVDSNNIFQYDIETHLPYHEVMMENDNDSYNGDIVADREWVVVVRTSVRGFFVNIVGIFRCEPGHSQLFQPGASVAVYHVG